MTSKNGSAKKCGSSNNIGYRSCVNVVLVFLLLRPCTGITTIKATITIIPTILIIRMTAAMVATTTTRSMMFVFTTMPAVIPPQRMDSSAATEG